VPGSGFLPGFVCILRDTSQLYKLYSQSIFNMSGNVTVGAQAPHDSDARFETSAAWATAEASSAEIAQEVDQNASQLQNAAQDAAQHAPYKEPAAVAAVDQLEAGLSNKTNAAASQGQADVGGYVEQAKNLANSAYQTAQQYLPDSETTSQTVQSAIGAGKEYVATAQSYVQPQLEKARGAVSGLTGSGIGSSGTDTTESV